MFDPMRGIEAAAAAAPPGEARARAALAALTAFAVVLAAGRWLIPFLAARQFLETSEKGDSERLDELHAHKRNTPTLGGLLILLGTVAGTLPWARWGERLVLLLLAYMLSLGVLGLLDDLTKLRTGRKGLSARRKLAAQLVLSAAAAGYLFAFPVEAVRHPAGGPIGTALSIPFPGGVLCDLGWLFPFFAVLVCVGASNAVNLTDGLDGLAAGSSVIVGLALAAPALVAGGGAVSGTSIVGGLEVAVFLCALAGAGLGFLWFNCHPARVFMGDTGALALGGALGLAALALKEEFLLLFAGGVLVAETFSVVLQVASYKLFRKRVFLIAPLHHHFQFKGWPETRITTRFWIAGAVLAVAGVAAATRQ
jgi:phospho-N-acetylmuramoyl-pentapeptide-transferase